MFEIERVSIHNFFCLRDFEISFKDRGLVLINGPNGSGKSSIYEAILWCLFNKTARQSRVDDVVNDVVKKDCQVTIDGTLNGRPIKVSRFRKHSVVGNDLVVIYDGENFTGSVTEIQNQLEQVVRADFNQFLLISSFIPDRIKAFAAATPSQRLAIIGGILDLQRFDAAYDFVRSTLKELQAELSTVNRELNVVEQNLNSIKSDIEYLQKKKATREAEIKEEEHELVLEKRRIVYRMKQIQKELAALSAKSEREYEQEEVELKGKRDEISKRLTQISGKIHSLNEKYQELQEVEAENYVGQPCPICERPISKNLVHKLIKSHKKKMEIILTQLRKLEKEKENLEDELVEMRNRLDYLLTEKASLEKAKLRYEGEMSNLKEKMSFIQNKLSSFKNEMVTYDDLLQKRMEDLEKITEGLSDLETSREKLEKRIGLYEVLKDMFGKKGIRFEYIRRVLGKLEEETRNILHILSSSKLDLEIDVNDKDEIEIKVYKMGSKRRYEDCSSGEKHRIECALAFGLNKMARSFKLMRTNFLFLDELFDRALDTEGQEKVFEILKQMEQEVETVFVVSHRPDLQSQFSNVILM